MASPSPFLPSASITTATVSHYATNVQGSSSTSTLRPPPNPPNPPTVSVPVTIAEPIETSLDVPVTPTRPSTPSWDRKRSLSTGAAWNDAREPSGFTQVRLILFPLLWTHWATSVLPLDQHLASFRC